jgi:hypothetical protein
MIEDTILSEGGLLTWTNRAGDAGGETVGGVSRVHHPKLAWWADVDILRPQFGWAGDEAIDLSQGRLLAERVLHVDLIERGVLAFYHRQGQLTRSVHVTEIESQAVAGKLFDAKINGGGVMLKHCVKAVQKVIGATADGALGPNTLAALNHYTRAFHSYSNAALDTTKDTPELLIAIAQAMCLRYARIVQGKVRGEIRDLARAFASPLGWDTDEDMEKFIAALSKERYDKTDAGNLGGWLANRAFKGVS